MNLIKEEFTSYIDVQIQNFYNESFEEETEPKKRKFQWISEH